MTRHDLIALLTSYDASADETAHVARVVELLRAKDDCFYRTCFEPGHITGSALLVSADNTRVLMNHHGSLDKWICFGGHADGDENILNVARRELEEESGILNLEPVLSGIFDVDVHDIPANPKKGEPAHAHFDIRYLFRAAGPATFAASEESHEIRWCSYDAAMALAGDDSMRRLLHKWRAGLDDGTE
jgi:8-oxo-dGTP pyrophosphatase MutT (NUDIX family)